MKVHFEVFVTALGPAASDLYVNNNNNNNNNNIVIITAAFYLYSTTRCRSIVLCKSPIGLEEFAPSVLMGKNLHLP